MPIWISTPCLAVLAVALLFPLIINSISPFLRESPFSSTRSMENEMDDDAVTLKKGRVVIVIGSGLAGSSAALSAAATDPSAQVIILEKEQRPGGNSMKASSGINYAVAVEGVNDSLQAFVKDTLSSGGGRSNPELVETLVNDSKDAVDWLTSLGVDLQGTVQLGGHSHPRTHFPAAPGPNVGFAIMQAMHTAIAATPTIQLITSAKVVELLRDTQSEGGRVTGVRYVHTNATSNNNNSNSKEVTEVINADAVVLATGGFGASHELLSKYAPYAADLPTTNGPFAQGEGLKLAAHVGASMVDLQYVQIHPTGFVDSLDPGASVKFLAPEKLRGVGGILLDAKGKRFVNELATRAVVSAAILNLHPDHQAYLLLGSAAADTFGAAAMQFYVSKGLFKRVEGGVQRAAEEMGVKVDELKATLEAYNARCDDPDRNPPDSFGKTVFPSKIEFQQGCALYIARVVPVVHYTMGGAKIDVEGRVVDDRGGVIAGLFGAGEVTGGVHGQNRLGGNSLLECVVFGRRAGRGAAVF